MFVGEQLLVDAGAQSETVALTAVNTTGTNQITAVFGKTHVLGSPVQVLGGFMSGVVPTTMTNGSTASVLKLYGDINGDGKMVYVEYKCDTTTGNLYRNVMAWNAASKPALTSSQVLLSNVQPNPSGTAPFTYQQQAVGANTYVTTVAITLTVRTEEVNPFTQQYQTQTESLLNVSPRNVINVYQLASMGSAYANRLQPMPASVQNLLP
jgi:hypothetical protein